MDYQIKLVETRETIIRLVLEIDYAVVNNQHQKVKMIEKRIEVLGNECRYIKKKIAEDIDNNKIIDYKKTLDKIDNNI